jgi:hypothetical protein
MKNNKQKLALLTETDNDVGQATVGLTQLILLIQRQMPDPMQTARGASKNEEAERDTMTAVEEWDTQEQMQDEEHRW